MFTNILDNHTGAKLMAMAGDKYHVVAPVGHFHMSGVGTKVHHAIKATELEGATTTKEPIGITFVKILAPTERVLIDASKN